MSNYLHNPSEPIRYGNAFPWAGILAGVKRMVFYSFLVVCLLIALGVIGIIIVGLFADNEQVVDYF